MEGFLMYAFKMVLCSGLLFSYYWLFLRNKRLHTFNRFYLLAVLLLSLILPLLHFSLPGMRVPQVTGVYQLLEVVQGKDFEETEKVKTDFLFSWQIALTLLYAAVVCFMLVMLAMQLAWIYRLKRKGSRSQQQGYILIQTDNSKAPFSFMNVLFWNSNRDIASEEGKRIVKHELVHIRQWHTLDKLLVQSVLVFCWFNPFYWLLQKELSLVHEFIADEGAIENRDTEMFARMLLQEYCGIIYPDIILPFFYSSTKRRLFMLNQKNKPRFAATRRLMALPLLGAAVLFFSFRSADISSVRAQKTITLALDAGHGGEDNGAIGINGVKEKDLVLKITNRLAQMAKAYNVKVVSLRPEDQYISLPDRSTKANSANADMLISIHVNAPGKDQSNHGEGFEIVLEKRNKQYAASRNLASAMAAQLGTLKVPAQLVDRGPMILRSAAMPAIIIECGYIDNAADVQRINNPEELDRLCSKILTGLVLYRNGK